MALAPVLIPNPLFDEILDFVLSNPTPDEVIAFKPSDALNARLHYLLDQNSQGQITSGERAELDEFLQLNHFMNMLKIRARQKIGAA